MVVVAVITPVASAGVMLSAFLFLPLPANIPAREAPNQSQTSHVLDAYGHEIGTFKQFETSIPVKPSDIPKVLKQAIVAAEDRTFYKHGGVDPKGTLRALWTDLRHGGAVQGGSTITQQLVKNTVTGNQRSITRKIREAVLASQLARSVNKEDILFEYMSIIYLGEGAYGVGAAADTYFRKPVSQLTLSESALLAGLIPAPSRYSPRVDPIAAEQKRVRVLVAMLDQKVITKAQYDAAVQEKVWLISKGPPPGPATIIQPPQAQTTTQPYFTDYVFKYLAAKLPGGVDKIYQGGLKIETTLDPFLQLAAVQQVNGFLNGTAPDLQMTVVSVEPPTGFVRALVGGRGYDPNNQLNIALGSYLHAGGSGRQTGSSFKPFVLTEAFAQGISPNKTYPGSPYVTKDKTFTNYGGASYGTLTLRQATKKSVNTVFTRLLNDVGVEKTMALARDMGLETLPAYDPAKYGLGVALGAVEVSPLEMASAYGVFANRGVREEPTPIKKVTDRDGNVLIDNTAREGKRVLQEEVADNVTDVLKAVLIDGTAAGRGIDRPAAGKTGTTTDNRDSWFVGYTPTLSTSVWMGYTIPRPMKNIKGVASVTGGTHPARIWQAYMKIALKDVPIANFADPAPLKELADQAKRSARNGFDPGARQYPTGGAEGGPYVVEAPPPEADAPTTSTTSPGGTTTTTRPGPTTSFTIIGNQQPP